MKRGALLKELKLLKCVFVEHCKKHDRYVQLDTGKTVQVPRDPEIRENLARSIIKFLS